jgi:hypothetical protein
MKNVKRHLLAAPVIVALACTCALAQPQLSGNLSGNLGPGSYLVTGNCAVQSGATLTIAPGTTFLHSGNFTWTIYGLLTATGTQADSIKWIRQGTVSWGGLRFQAGASSNCQLNYCVIEYGVQSGLMVGGGLYVQNVPLTINHTRISNCTAPGDGAGIFAQSATIIIDHCLITNNYSPSGGNGGGIYLMNCSSPRISNSVIAYNTDTGS